MPGSLPIPDPISNPLVCTTSTAPASVTVSKTDISTGPYSEGDTITYQVAVTNNSTTDLSNASLFESLTPITITSDPLGLLTGGVCINAGFTSLITYDYVVRGADYTAGGITNTATLTSPSISEQASYFINIDNSGVMNIAKSVTSNTIYTLGSIISYRVDVSNSGGSNVDNIKVSDILSPITVTSDLSGILGQGRTFTPGAAATVEYSYIVTASDVLNGNVSNQASITVQTGGNLPFTITDETVTPLVPPGEFAVTKTTVTTGPYEVGDEIVYDISILNLTPITITNVSIIDDLTPITYVSGTNELLTGSIDIAPAESYFVRYKYLVTQGDNNSTLTNTATLSTSNYGTTVVSVSSIIDDNRWEIQDTFWETTSTYDWETSYEDFS